jgi:hypothetical protein
MLAMIVNSEGLGNERKSWRQNVPSAPIRFGHFVQPTLLQCGKCLSLLVAVNWRRTCVIAMLVCMDFGEPELNKGGGK